MSNKHSEKRIIFIGYIGQSNTGDDAFLLSSSIAAKKYLKPQEPIYSFSSKVPYTSDVAVKPIFPRLQFRASRAIYSRLFAKNFFLKTNHVIFAGGSILHTARSIAEKILLLDMAKPGLRFAIGVSIGPFKDKESAKICGTLISKLDFIGVRDQASFDRAKEICPSSNVHLTFDLAPLLPYFFTLPPKSHKRNWRLGISLCNYERFVGGDIDLERKRIEFVAEALNRSFQKGAFKEIILLDFNGHRTKGDHKLHLELKRRLNQKMLVKHYPYSENPLDFLNIISNLDALIGMRLHSNIFSFCVDTPTIMIAYHEKCYEWAKTVGIPSSFIFDSQKICPRTLARTIEKIMATPENATPSKLTYQESVELSLKNWTWLNNIF